MKNQFNNKIRSLRQSRHQNIIWASKSVLLLVFFALVNLTAFSQSVAINSSGDPANSKAMLDIESIQSGILIPRMTTAERNTITAPIPESLLIYNTTTECFEAYNNNTSAWVSFGCAECPSPGEFVASAASGITETSFYANWTESEGASTYYLDVNTKSDFTCNWILNNSNIGNSNIFMVNNLTCGNTYYYRLRAGNDCDISNSSNTITVNMSTACPCTWNRSYTHIVTHSDGDVAPETKTITYGQTQTSLSGSSKCWTTQNLGASYQAASATDATDAAAGWYWQFNRKQGYKVGPSPGWTTTSISEESDWSSANDPCKIELGAAWRIPTKTEWESADINGGWSSYNHVYASVLKLHALGYLHFNNGSLVGRSDVGDYWSSTQGSATHGWCLGFGNSTSYVFKNNKAYGFSLRCLRD